MTRTRSPGKLVAVCAVVALAAAGLGCDLNPQPLPPGGGGSSGFGSNPTVGGADAGGAALGGEGGLYLLSDAGASQPRGDAAADASAANPPLDADASDGAADGESGVDGQGDCESDAAEGEQ